MTSVHTHIALNRFGLGIQPGSSDEVVRDPKGWLHRQLRQSKADTPQGALKHSSQLSKEIAALKSQEAQDVKKMLRKQGRQTYLDEQEARFEVALQTENTFIERLVHFWSNHFTVSTKGKPFLGLIVGAFEREAIRPHVLGKFSDMLTAVVQHPAMLIYLDNASSFGPNSKGGERRGRGLNENLAREILELHTLGVGGGYTQNDVIALAKIITGWTITPPRLGGGGYRYVDAIHEPGTHVLLGRSYDQDGEAQGLAALQDLTRHPSTARFIASKLARHFVSDTPNEETIQTLANVFTRTDGDLKAMAKALIDLPQVWQDPLTKVKTPYELVVSTLRLLDPKQRAPFQKILAALTLMNHTPFGAPSPAGYPDSAADWISPSAMMQRVEWVHAAAQVNGGQADPMKLAKQAIGPVASPETLLWIDRAPSAQEGLALLLASPEFQRR